MVDDDKRQAGIDGLRAIAMSMVIAQHSGLLPFGWTGVWLFYVISGYVIALGLERDVGGHVLRRFWRRRAARIVPAYLLYLALNAALLVAIGRPEPLMEEGPWLLGFVHNWHMIFAPASGAARWPPFGHLWTLSVEQQFYLVFPLLVLVLDTTWRVRASVALVLLGPLLRAGWSAWLEGRGLPPGQAAFGVYAASHVQFDAFLLGTLIARAERAGALQGGGASRWGRRAWAVALAAGLSYTASYVLVNHAVRGAHGMGAWRDIVSGVLWGQGREAWVYSVVALVAAAAVLQTLAGARGWRWLAWPRLAAIGRASYSGYLLHLLLLWLAGAALQAQVRELAPALRLAAFAAVWLATVALSRWSWRYVEMPAGRWLRGDRPLDEMGRMRWAR